MERFKELEQRYNTLYAWAKDQSFTIVYRAEGPHKPELQKSEIGGESTWAGTWFTPSYDFAFKHYKPVIEQNGEGAVIRALIIPQSLLDDRDATQKGMNEVSVINKDLLAGCKTISSPQEMLAPTLDNYLDQFSFVREYKDLKKVCNAE